MIKGIEFLHLAFQGEIYNTISKKGRNQIKSNQVVCKHSGYHGVVAMDKVDYESKTLSLFPILMNVISFYSIFQRYFVDYAMFVIDTKMMVV